MDMIETIVHISLYSYSNTIIIIFNNTLLIIGFSFLIIFA